LSAYQASEVAKNYADNIQETELIEIIEKLIASGIEDLIDTEGAA